MLIFHFLDKGLGTVSPAHFVYNLSKKMFLMLQTKCHCLVAFTSSDIGHMCIAIVYYLGCDVMDFEINLMFLKLGFHDGITWYNVV